MVKIKRDKLEKFSDFIVEEMLYNRGKNLLKTELPFFDSKNRSQLSTILLTESEYDNLISKLLFQMKNKYLNYNQPLR